MAAWDAIAQLSVWPALAGPRYGFHSTRRGGCQVGNPLGWDWPMSGYLNCCTFAAQVLHLAAHGLDRAEVPLTFEHWRHAMVWEGRPEYRDGIAGVAVALGHARAVERDFGVVHEGRWYACQGWQANGRGHTFFLRGVPGEEDSMGLVYLEANGRSRGGPVDGGLDGVGSRSMPEMRRNARDWRGRVPWDDMTPQRPGDILDDYQTLHIARLL